MALEQLDVWEIVKQSVDKNIDIPEFQREFVWDAAQVRDLADSLYRDYPVGSFLLWNCAGYQEARTAEGTQASLWIVDGQQRTTALCLLMGQKPYWWSEAEKWNEALERYDVMVNLLPDDGEHLEFALANPIRRRDPRWVAIRRILSVQDVENLTPLAQEIVHQITEDPNEMMSVFGKIHPRVQRVWQIRQRDIPIVKISHEVEDVAEIFGRLNQAGTRVKEADVVLSLVAVRNPGWVREEYLPYRNDLEDRGWDLNAGIFIRTMSGIGRGRARLIEVPNDFWSPQSLPSVWKEARTAISEVLKRLAEFGIMSADLLPSSNSLIPLFVLQNRWADHSSYRFGKALCWFLMANWDGRYSGSAITHLNEDVRAITEASDADNAVKSLSERLRVTPSIEPEEFLNRYDRAGNRFLRLMVYLLMFERNAPDWVDGTRLGYDRTGSPVTTGFQPQWHHIYPRSVLRKAGSGDDEIHALANITVLNERSNVNKLSGKEPARYIQEFGVSPLALKAHLIPEPFAEAAPSQALLEEQWPVERYTDFLIDRAELLAQSANAFLQNLVE